MNCLLALGAFPWCCQITCTERIVLKEFDSQIVIKIGSVRNLTNKTTQGTESGTESEILFQLTSCNDSSSMSCEQFVGIIVNKKYSFSEDDLTICKNILKVRATQGNLKIANKWFERVATNVRIPCFFWLLVITFLKDSGAWYSKVAKTLLSIINSAQDFYIQICSFLLDNIA